MLIYIIFFILLFASSMLEVGGLKKSQARWLLVLLTLFTILFAGLRYNTGGDWYIYKQIFNSSLASNDNPRNSEYGYVLLNKLFKSLFDNYYVFQFATSLFVGICSYRLYKRYSDYPIISFSLFAWAMFSTILFSQIRQSIALSFIMLATPYIFERKLLRFSIMIAIACSFHISAILAFPVYFLYRDYGKALPLLLMVIAQILFFFPEIIVFCVSFVASYMPERLSEKALAYIDSYFNKRADFSSGIFYFGQMCLSVLTFLLFNAKDKKEAFFLNTLAVSIIIKGFSIGFEIIGRLEPYYYAYAIIAYTRLFTLRSKRSKSMYLVSALVLLMFFSVPFIRVVTKSDLDALTKRPANYSLVPYYNSLSHPPEASKRKDWCQN